MPEVIGEYRFMDGHEEEYEYDSMQGAINDIDDVLESHDAFMDSFRLKRT